MSIHVYAEHLGHIGSCSVYITLPSASNSSTAVSLVSFSSLNVKHDGEEVSIALPATVLETPNTILQVPAKATTNLVYQFRCDNPVTSSNDDTALIVPWTATTLTNTTEISCSRCTTVLVSRSKINQWKDLPSDGWAEMMDFWHCHKPNEPHDHDETTSSKGYSAASKLAVEPGVAFVKTMSILFVTEDLLNIEVSTLKSSPINA